MSENIICLSDSDESLITSERRTSKDRNNSYSDETDCFDFPAVEFTYQTNDFPALINDDKSSNDANVEKNNYTNKKNEKSRNVENIVIRRNVEKPVTADHRVIEEKSLKALRKRNAENIRPGKCLKLMQVCLDKNLENYEFKNGIIDELKNFDISWKWQNLSVPNSIAWTRETEEEYSTSDGKISSRTKFSNENHKLIIWDRDEIVRRIQEGSFVSAIRDSVNFEANARFTIILYGMEKYFRDFGKSKEKSCRGVRKTNKNRDASSSITRQDFEIALADIQINLKCANRLIDTPQEIGSLVYEFTKSIAEIPYKLEKRNKLEEKLDWYSTGDNSDTVRVDKSGIGLKSLWQRQLCQFNLASLETAEAISAIYPSPRDLVEAYEKCASDEGEGLLKDIPIRRAAGPLSTVRTIGPVLSKTLYAMFTSLTGDTLLGNEK